MSLIRHVVGKPKRKRSLGRPRRRWEDNIRLDIREVVWKVRGWICLTEDRVQWRGIMNTVMKLLVS